MITPPVTIRRALVGGGYWIVDARDLIVAGVSGNQEFQRQWADGVEAAENAEHIASMLNGNVAQAVAETITDTAEDAPRAINPDPQEARCFDCMTKTPLPLPADWLWEQSAPDADTPLPYEAICGSCLQVREAWPSYDPAKQQPSTEAIDAGTQS